MLLNIDTSQLATDGRQLSTVLLFLVLDILLQGNTHNISNFCVDQFDLFREDQIV